MKTSKIKEAKAMFFLYQGSKYYMGRAGHLSDYEQYAINASLEKKWYQELLQNYWKKLDLEDQKSIQELGDLLIRDFHIFDLFSLSEKLFYAAENSSNINLLIFYADFISGNVIELEYKRTLVPLYTSERRSKMFFFIDSILDHTHGVIQSADDNNDIVIKSLAKIESIRNELKKNSIIK